MEESMVAALPISQQTEYKGEKILYLQWSRKEGKAPVNGEKSVVVVKRFLRTRERSDP